MSTMLSTAEPLWHTRPLVRRMSFSHDWQAMRGGKAAGPRRFWQIDAIRDLEKIADVRLAQTTYSVLGGEYGVMRVTSELELQNMRELGPRAWRDDQ